MQKRGQITIYIILGILVLLALGISVYFLTKPSTIYVPPEIQPVYDHVASCVSSVSKEAVLRLGFQGGYLNIPQKITRNQRSFVALDNSGEFKIPYWYFGGEDRTPSIQVMEREIAQYVKQNLPGCVDFDSLKDFAVTELGMIEPKVIIAEKDIKIDVAWPLQIKAANNLVNHRDFRAELDVKLKKIWELANKIMTSENKDMHFEKLTVDLMATDDKIPMNGMDFSCGTKTWHVNDVKKQLKDILSYNIPYIRVHNTNYVPFQEELNNYQGLEKSKEKIYSELRKDVAFEKIKLPDNVPEDALDYSKLTFDVGTKVTDLKINFLYLPNSVLELSALPSDGGILKSNKIAGSKKFLRFLCINQWHFVYNVIYPIVSVISDDTAFNGDGYFFRFAFPVLINMNEGERLYYGLRRMDTIDIDTDFCQKLGDQAVEINARGFESGIPFAIPLDNVNITYKCGNELCNLGTTKAEDGDFKLTTRIPKGCGNPFIVANKEDYLEAQSVLEFNQNFVDITMKQLAEKNIEVVKHNYDSVNDKLSSVEENLGKDESIFIYLYLHNSQLDQYIDYPSNKKLVLLADDATYDIDLIYNDALNYTIGGYHAENVKINIDESADKDTIVLHAIEYAPIPDLTDEKSRAEMVSFIYQGKYNNELKPTFR